jgi:hypothetical protein
VIRAFHTILKNLKGLDSQYNDGVYNDIVVKYMETLGTKLKTQIEALGKENIDSLGLSVTASMRTLYKLKKFEVASSQTRLIEVSKVLQEAFLAVSKKEEMAKKVLSGDVLSKFKAIKEALLKALILA